MKPSLFKRKADLEHRPGGESERVEGELRVRKRDPKSPLKERIELGPEERLETVAEKLRGEDRALRSLGDLFKAERRTFFEAELRDILLKTELRCSVEADPVLIGSTVRSLEGELKVGEGEAERLPWSSGGTEERRERSRETQTRNKTLK